MSSENFSRMLRELEIFFLSKWGNETPQQPYGSVQLEAKYFQLRTLQTPRQAMDVVSDTNILTDSAARGLAGNFWA